MHFVENFDNDQNSHIYDVAAPLARIPDRNGTFFISSEGSHVDSFTGSLKFSSDKQESLVDIKQEDIKSINFYTNFPTQNISSDTGITNIITGNSNNSWNLTVKSPSVINSSIFSQAQFQGFNADASGIVGAEIAVSVELNKSVDAQRIRISPNIGQGLYATQIVLDRDVTNSNTSDNQTNKISVLKAPIYVDRNLDIDFAKTKIKGFIIFFKQKNYNRTKLAPVQSELNSKLVSILTKALRNEKKKNHDLLQDYVLTFFLKDSNKNYILRNKNIYNYDYTKYYPTEQSKKEINLLKEIKKDISPSDLESKNLFKNSDFISNIVFAIVSYSLGAKFRGLNSSTYIESNLLSNIKSIQNYASGGMLPLGDSNTTENNVHLLNETYAAFSKVDALDQMNNIEQSNLYEYMFSIKNISLFTTTSITAGALTRSNFVSKKIKLEGKPLSVKMMTNYLNRTVSSSSNAMSDPTSVEFSVTVKDNPTDESDWYPIMPYIEKEITAELMMFSASDGKAKFRFAPKQETVFLYKDGTLLPASSYTITGMYLSVTGRQANSIYVCNYQPINLSTSKEISLFSRNLSSPVLSTYSSEGKNGERFTNLNYDNSVTLSQTPYIDRSKFSNASYSSYNGTVTSSNSSFGNFDYSSYSPVKVVFEDGTVAKNLSNYILTDTQLPSFEDRTDYCFTHYDNTLMFNKKINTPFRVLYDYIPDIFRYRVIFRNLNSTQENYSVDRLMFKFSSEKEDAITNNFIRYDNIFKSKLI